MCAVLTLLLQMARLFARATRLILYGIVEAWILQQPAGEVSSRHPLNHKQREKASSTNYYLLVDRRVTATLKMSKNNFAL